MKSLFRHITLRILAFSTLLIFLAVSSLWAQGHRQTLESALNSAQKQGIPKQDIDNLVQRARGKNISNDEIAGMLQPAIKLASQDLPYDLVIQKSLEGMAKGVQPSIIMKVENRLQSNTVDAAHLTDDWLEEPPVQNMLNRSSEQNKGNGYRNLVLNTVAKVLFQDMPHKDVGQLLSDMAQNDVCSKMDAKQVPMAIRILPDLATSKHHPEVSRALIIQAIKGHFTPDQIQQLPMAMARAEQANQLPAEALAHGIGKQINEGVPPMTILQGLFEGNSPGGPPNGVPPGLNNPHAKGPHGNGPGNHGNGHGNGGGNGNGNSNGNGHGNGNGGN